MLFTIFSMFVLVSCNDGNDTSNGSSNNETSIVISLSDDVDESNSNSTKITNEEPPTNIENTNKNSNSNINDDSVYDDGIDWGPLH